MDNLQPLPRSSGLNQVQVIHSDPLPHWEQLPRPQQQDLIMLLATLLGKCLPSQTGLAGQEARGE
jgi:hypothetical protein